MEAIRLSGWALSESSQAGMDRGVAGMTLDGPSSMAVATDMGSDRGLCFSQQDLCGRRGKGGM